MDKQYFIDLVHKYLKGTATKEEQQFLTNYYNLFQYEEDVVALLSKEEKDNLKLQMHNAVWKNISQVEQKDHKVISIRKWIVRVSAAAVLVGLCGTGLFFLFNEKSTKQNIAGSVAGQTENRIVRLADGSTVILHAGGTLDYPSSFEGLSKREVYLHGQAYFDIKSDPSHPFIVHTGKIETIVLGTAFNIKANPGEVDITVTVTRGRVKVCDQSSTLGIIIENQQIVYNKQKSISVQNKVNAQTFITWKEQDLLFDNVTVEEATAILEERFNVHIVFKDSLIRSNRFTTSFSKGENLEQLLKSICEFNGAVYDYDIDKATVSISSNDTSVTR